MTGQVLGRANGAGTEVAAAIGTGSLQLGPRTGGAERALERADEGFGRFRGQVPVAPFAIGSQFEHTGKIPETHTLTDSGIRTQ